MTDRAQNKNPLPRRWIKRKGGYFCTGCQEPIGPPWVHDGCMCSTAVYGPHNDRQRAILAEVRAQLKQLRKNARAIRKLNKRIRKVRA